MIGSPPRQSVMVAEEEEEEEEEVEGVPPGETQLFEMVHLIRSCYFAFPLALYLGGMGRAH